MRTHLPVDGPFAGIRDLPPGIDLELFTGPTSPESATERSARLAVARAVLAELREQGHDDEISAADARFAAELARAERRRQHRHTRRGSRGHLVHGLGRAA